MQRVVTTNIDIKHTASRFPLININKWPICFSQNASISNNLWQSEMNNSKLTTILFFLPVIKFIWVYFLPVFEQVKCKPNIQQPTRAIFFVKHVDICFIFVCRPIKPFFSQVDWLRLTCIVVTAQQRCNYKSANTVISLRQNTTALRRTTDGGSHQRLFLQCKSAVQHTNIHYLPSYLKQTHHVNKQTQK